MSSTRTFIREHPIAAAFFFLLAAVLAIWIGTLVYMAFSFVHSSACRYKRLHGVVAAGISVEVAEEDCFGIIASPLHLVVRASSLGGHDEAVVFRCDCGDVQIEQADSGAVRLIVPVERAAAAAPLQEPPLWLIQPNWKGATFTYEVREAAHKR